MFGRVKGCAVSCGVWCGLRLRLGYGGGMSSGLFIATHFFRCLRPCAEVCISDCTVVFFVVSSFIYALAVHVAFSSRANPYSSGAVIQAYKSTITAVPAFFNVVKIQLVHFIPFVCL